MYQFWVAGDDSCELYLSSDETRANLRWIAAHYGSTSYNEWDRSATQRSEPVMLERGKGYLMVAVGKEAHGRDHVSVAVRVPDTCTRNLTICRYTHDPRNGRDAMPISEVMRLPTPLFSNATANVTRAPLQRDLGQLAFLSIHDPFVAFDSVEEMVQTAMPTNRLADVLAALEFHNTGQETQGERSGNAAVADDDDDDVADDDDDDDDAVAVPQRLSYSIRMNPVKVPATDRVTRRLNAQASARDWWEYYYSGFAVVQDMVDRAFISLHTVSLHTHTQLLACSETKHTSTHLLAHVRVCARVCVCVCVQGRDTVTELPLFAQPFPLPAAANDDFVRVLGPVLPLLMTVSFVYVVSITVKSIVYEKEMRLKETMRILGLCTSVHWVARLKGRNRGPAIALEKRTGLCWPHIQPFILFWVITFVKNFNRAT